MNLSLGTSVPALTVFIQGLLSFFSPCVLPLVPLYMGYLAGGAKTVDENGKIVYPRRLVFINTIFFILGISFAFFLLGFGFTALGRFFSSNRVWFARISGVIMILFGLYQFGAFGHAAPLEQEHRLPLKLNQFTMNPIIALLLGFTFSFAWTPCVGPTLGSVLLMASSASSSTTGFILIGVYTLGFVLPFLAVGLFAGTVLDLFKKHVRVVQYTVKMGAALLILMGIMTLTGFMNGVTGYLSGIVGGNPTSSTQTQAPSTSVDPSSDSSEAEKSSNENGSAELPVIPAPDFTLIDQYGQTHTLSDYKGKTVFLNFWATWCTPCKREMPDIQALYEAYGENSEDLIILGVANPKTDDSPYNQDISQEEIISFLEENQFTFPVVMDTTGDTLMNYAISSFPTTFMIDKEGNIFGYVPGMLTRDMMESIVQQTMTGERVE